MTESIITIAENLFSKTRNLRVASEFIKRIDAQNNANRATKAQMQKYLDNLEARKVASKKELYRLSNKTVKILAGAGALVGLPIPLPGAMIITSAACHKLGKRIGLRKDYKRALNKY